MLRAHCALAVLLAVSGAVPGFRAAALVGAAVLQLARSYQHRQAAGE
jgi:hypothetical protein